MKKGVDAESASAVSECGNLGVSHVGLAWLHQLVCVLPHMVSSACPDICARLHPVHTVQLTGG